MNRYLLIVLCLTVLSSCSNKEHIDPILKPIDFQLFKKSDPLESGVLFKNTLEEDFSNGHNRFEFDYFYNGSGIGVADLNNDGLDEIFFTGNQVKNKLFLNLGGMKFKDITSTANVNMNKGWATGVTFADINNDGWLDIYVSQGGPLGYDRSNRLYINNGDLTFTERSVKYQLDYKGLSTQSVFFDYDKDGDLDCLIINEHPLYGFSAREFQYYLKKKPKLLHASSCHLFEKANDRYVEVTEKAGLLKPAFGLGVVVTDLNKDGWQDFYLSNDYYIPDALYINQRNGTFRDEIKERTRQVAYAGMGVDIADLNNDGFYDIFSLDMASPDHVRAKVLMQPMNVKFFDYLVNELDYHYTYMFNTLQYNVGNGSFQNIPHMAGVAKTDWSWAGLIADFDNDADKDIFVSNGTEFTLDNDFHAKVKAVYAKYPEPNPIPVAELEALHDQIPNQKLPNLLFRNIGDYQFKNMAAQWGLNESTFSNGAAYADLDQDGDLDLIVNNNNQEAVLYTNTLSENAVRNYLKVKAIGNVSESFPRVRLQYSGIIQEVEISRVRGYLSSVENKAHFGLGKVQEIDTLRVVWPSGKFEERYNVEANQTVVFKEKHAIDELKHNSIEPGRVIMKENDENLIPYQHVENRYDDFKKESLLPYKQSTQGPFITKGDVNGDGLEDVFIGGPSGQAGQLFVQTFEGFAKVESRSLEKDRWHEDMESVFFDVDVDGDLDLFVVSGGNESGAHTSYYADRLYVNDGKGNFSSGSKFFRDSALRSGRSVAVIDFDNDNDLDLVVGNRMVPGKYPLYEPSVLYQNDKGILRESTSAVAPDLGAVGAVNKVIATDFDLDGWMDLMLVGEWTGIEVLKNEKGVFRNISSAIGLDKEVGWWFTIGKTDLDGDGLPDYVVGNVGLNTKYKTSSTKPLKIFAGDFDDNGSHDMMLSYQYKTEYVPLRGRECSSGQMPFIKEKFPTYASFANATMANIFGHEQLSIAYQEEVSEFRSILLKNLGDGKFEKVMLPPAAQIFPVMSLGFSDFNGDGHEDVILAGGIYNTEVETPRLDGGVGLAMLSDGYTYQSLPWSASGLYIPGNVKSIAFIEHEGLGQKLLLVARNNEPIQVLRTVPDTGY